MSASDVTYIGMQGSYVIPIPIRIPEIMPEPLFASVTGAQNADTVSLSSQCLQKIYDPKSGLHIWVLSFPKDARALDETEGILNHLAPQLEKEGLDSVKLVKRAWKTSEQNDEQPST